MTVLLVAQIFGTGAGNLPTGRRPHTAAFLKHESSFFYPVYGGNPSAFYSIASLLSTDQFKVVTLEEMIQLAKKMRFTLKNTRFEVLDVSGGDKTAHWADASIISGTSETPARTGNWSPRFMMPPPVGHTVDNKLFLVRVLSVKPIKFRYKPSTFLLIPVGTSGNSEVNI